MSKTFVWKDRSIKNADDLYDTIKRDVLRSEAPAFMRRYRAFDCCGADMVNSLVAGYHGVPFE